MQKTKVQKKASYFLNKSVLVGPSLDEILSRWSDRFFNPPWRESRFHEFFIFVIKQGVASIYGGLLLMLILSSSFMEFERIARYDFLFICAVLIQLSIYLLKLENFKEARIILLFHFIATLMELFKTHPAIQSWQYPEACFFKIGGVPLFSGFMYSAVGSFILRSWKLMHLRFKNYPPFVYTLILSILIYVNYFSHHFIADIRLGLFLATCILFFKTEVHFYIYGRNRKMPLLVAFVLIAFFLWIAENVGTYASIWHYPHQEETWQWVSFHKMGAWYLLMIVSFVLVSFEFTSTLYNGGEK